MATRRLALLLLALLSPDSLAADPPVATFQPPVGSQPAGSPVTLDASASSGTAPLSFEWSFGDLPRLTAFSQLSPATRPSGRRAATLSYDVADKVSVLFGGNNGTTPIPVPFEDTWLFNGTTWQKQFPTSTPAARSRHAIAYDSARGRHVLFGGRDSSNAQLAETWEWDGTDWLSILPGTSPLPPARSDHGMAFSTATSTVILFGGLAGSTSKKETWAYSGSVWSQLSPTTSPSARSSHAMVYDSRRDRVVLFGGNDSAGEALGDTWEFDGTNWAQRTPATSPAARTRLAMAFDSARGRTVLFGGAVILAGTQFNDIWEWDGTSWELRDTSATPPSKSRHVMAYDAERAQVVSFGGDDGSSDVSLLADAPVLGSAAFVPNSSAGAVVTSFTPTVAGTYEVTLTLTDGASASSSLTTDVVVIEESTPLTATLAYGRPARLFGAGTFAVTATFSAGITPTAPQIDLAGGTSSGDNDVAGQRMTGTAGGTVWTYSRPIVGTFDDGSFTITLTAASAETGALTTQPAERTFTLETIAPAVFLSYDKSTAAVGTGDLVVSALFTESLATTPTISIDRPGSGNDVTAANLSGSGSLWTFTYSVLSQNAGTILDGPTSVTITGGEDAAGNANQPAANDTFTIDTAGPTATLTFSKSSPYAPAETFLVTADFSEPVTPAKPTIAIAGGSGANNVVAVEMTGPVGGTVFTFTRTVQAGDDATFTIALAAADALGNALSVQPSGRSFGIVTPPPPDTTRPTVALTYSKSTAAVGTGNLVVTATFSEALATTPTIGIDRPGTGNDVVAANLSGSGSVWSFTYNVLPQNGGTIQDGLVTVTIAGGEDAAGNANQPATNNTFTTDTAGPAVVSLSCSTPACAIGIAPVRVIVTFDEPLLQKPSITYGVSGIGSGIPGASITGAGQTWSFAHPFSDVDDGTAISILVEAEDAAGNVRLSSVLPLGTADKLAPTATLAYSKPSLAYGAGPFTVTATFSEAISPSAPTIAIAGSASVTTHDVTTTAMTASGSDRSVWSFSRDITDSQADDGTFTITLSAADAVGNMLTTQSDNRAFTIDTTHPSVALSYSRDTTAVPDGRLVVTATFSESLATTPRIAIEATGAPNDLPATSMSGSGSIWTYEHTVVADGDGEATVQITGGHDAAGNENLVATNDSFTIAVPVTTHLTATLQYSKNPPVYGVEPFAVTATFSEPLSPSAPTIQIGGGSAFKLNDVSPGVSMTGAAGGTVFTFTRSVVGRRLDDGSFTITLTGTADSGNVLETQPLSRTFTIVTPANRSPVASFTVSRSPTAGQTVTLDGDGSSDPDGDPLVYRWSFTQVASPVEFDVSPPASRRTFTPPAAGRYGVQLVVDDGLATSPPALHELDVLVPAPPTATLTYSRSNRVFGLTPLTVTATFSEPITPVAPQLATFGGITASFANDVVPTDMTQASPDRQVWTYSRPFQLNETDDGSFTLTLTASGRFGNSLAEQPADRTFSVDTRLVAFFESSGQARAADPLPLDGRQSVTPDPDVPLTYVWSVPRDATWLQRTTNQQTGSPPTRFLHAMTYDSGRKKVVMFGGSPSPFGGNENGDTWEWDESGWRNATPSTGSPPARASSGMVFDTARQRAVIFGGKAPAPERQRNDLWEWDGTGWTKRTPATAPPARAHHAMAFDTARNRLVLFGGLVENPAGQADTTLGDLWEWDGTSWFRRNQPMFPPGRFSHGMTYDALRGRTVLFGGVSKSGSPPLNDTWEWDGNSWTRVGMSSVTPPGRVQLGLTYSPDRGTVSLFGGAIGFLNLTDTWEWDGQSWTDTTSPGASPTPLNGSGVAYDAARRRLVSFGNAGTNDTWELPAVDFAPPSAFVPNSSEAAAQTTFTPPRPGEYRVRLVVRAGTDGISAPFERVVTATLALPLEASLTYSIPDRVYPDGAFAVTATFSQDIGAVAPLLTLAGGAPGSLANDVASAPMTLAGSGRRVWTYSRVLVGRGVDNGVFTLTLSAVGAALSTIETQPANSTFTVVTSLPPTARFSARVPIVSGRPLELDGRESSDPDGDTLVYKWSVVAQPGSDTYLLKVAPSEPRADQGLGYDVARQKLVRFGSFFRNDIHELDVTSKLWRGIAPAAESPAPARDYGAFVFDSTRRTLLLWDGSSLWAWTGVRWEKKVSTTTPPSRQRPALAYDAARDRVVMIGGTGLVADIWEWDGVDWREAHPPAGAPAPLSAGGYGRHLAAFDPGRRQVVYVEMGLGKVLPGEVTVGDIHYNEVTGGQTWEWNGTSWRDTGASLVRRPNAGDALAFAPSLKRIVLLESAPTPKRAARYFTWDGSRWLEARLTSSRRFPVYFESYAYDVARQRMIEFGGNFSPDLLTFKPISETREMVLSPGIVASDFASNNGGQASLTSFTPPVAGGYRIRLVVNDGFNDSDPFEASVNAVLPSVPTVDLTYDKTPHVYGAEAFTVTATFSDPIGPLPPTLAIAGGSTASTANDVTRTPMTSSPAGPSVWTFTRQIASGDDGAFTVDVNAIATTGLLNSPAADAAFTIQAAGPPPANRRPVAKAFSPTAPVGSVRTITLDATGSQDPDGPSDIASYRWSLTKAPGTAGRVLTGADTSSAEYSATKAGDYSFELLVADRSGLTSSASLNFQVAAGTPNAVLDPPGPVLVNLPRTSSQPGVQTRTVVALSTKRSFHTGGASMLASFELLEAPGRDTSPSAARATVVPSGAGRAELRFQDPDGGSSPGRSGRYVVRATLTDAAGLASSAEVAVDAVDPDNPPPVASAGEDASYAVTFQGDRIDATVPDPTLPASDNRRAHVRLDGRRSSGPAGRTLSYLWEVARDRAGNRLVPQGSGVTGGELATDPTPRFVPDKLGDYVFRLRVSYGSTESPPDTVRISIRRTGDPAPLTSSGSGEFLKFIPDAGSIHPAFFEDFSSRGGIGVSRGSFKLAFDSRSGGVSGTVIYGLPRLGDATPEGAPILVQNPSGAPPAKVEGRRIDQPGFEPATPAGTAFNAVRHSEQLTVNGSVATVQRSLETRTSPSNNSRSIQFSKSGRSPAAPAQASLPSVFALMATASTTATPGAAEPEGFAGGLPGSLRVHLPATVTLHAQPQELTTDTRYRLTWRQLEGPSTLLSQTDTGRTSASLSSTEFVPFAPSVHVFEVDFERLNPASEQPDSVTTDGDATTGDTSSRRIRVIVDGPGAVVPEARAVALASIPQTGGAEARRVTLDGRPSVSASAAVGVTTDSLAYVWTQVSGPRVVIEDPYAAMTSFLAPESPSSTQRYELTLRVEASGLRSEAYGLALEQRDPPRAGGGFVQLFLGDRPLAGAPAALGLDGTTLLLNVVLPEDADDDTLLTLERVTASGERTVPREVLRSYRLMFFAGGAREIVLDESAALIVSRAIVGTAQTATVVTSNVGPALVLGGGGGLAGAGSAGGGGCVLAAGGGAPWPGAVIFGLPVLWLVSKRRRRVEA